MPRPRKREIGGLDDLLLGVMLREGTISIHQMYSQLGLSPGSTSRSLERLARFRLAKGETGEGARKTAFEITDEGRDHLREVWRIAVSNGRESMEPEEVLRAVMLAALMGAEDELRMCIPKLRDLAANRRVQATGVIKEAEFRNEMISSYYGQLRAIYEAGRMRGESEALDEISYRLERSPPYIYRKEDSDVQD